MDVGVVAATVCAGALVGLLAGAVPAAWAARTRLRTLLGNAAVRGGGRGRLRRALVVVQVALSLMLLSTGGLLARSFGALLRTDPGFDPEGVLSFRVPVPEPAYPEDASVRALHARLQRELAALPGVEAVGAASGLPLTATTDQSDMEFPGAPGDAGDGERDAPLVDVIQARHGFLETLRIRVLAGRGLGPARPGGPPEAVVDRTLAERFFPGGAAVGARVPYGGDTLTVVGVVQHARQNDLHRDGRPQVYIHNDFQPYRTLAWVVRGDRPPAELLPWCRTRSGGWTRASPWRTRAPWRRWRASRSGSPASAWCWWRGSAWAPCSSPPWASTAWSPAR